MHARRWPTVALTTGLLMAVACVAAAYFVAWGRLESVRRARRDDDHAAAESRLAACWRLPGLAAAIDLEEQLLGVQQGDLGAEKKWQARAATGSSYEGGLIREALGKGALASLRRTLALDYAESAVKRQPANGQVIGTRGRARFQTQQEEEAIVDLKRAVELEPESFELRRSLAEAVHDTGHVHEAIGHYQQLLSRRPDDERVVLSLARCLEEEARLEEARDLIDGWLEARPDSPAGLVGRARIARRMGDAEAAERAVRRAIELRPDHAEATALLRRLLEARTIRDEQLEQRSEENGRRQTELTLRLLESQSDPKLLAEVGHWKLKTGLDREATGWFYAALQHDPASKSAHAGLAACLLRDGQPRRAAAHARRAGGEAVSEANSSATASGPAAGRREWRASGAVGGGEASFAEVERLCAACHAFPPPESMPRSAWRKEVKQGYDFLRESALSGEYPAFERVVRYYESRAPERLPPADPPPPAGNPPVVFERRGVVPISRSPSPPAITNVSLMGLAAGADPLLLMCDSRLNAVMRLDPREAVPSAMAIARVPAPCHVSACDLDGDGQGDLVVASLGSFFPTDDGVGKVFWLRGQADGRFEPHEILAGVGRVCDVRAADFNGDGRLDLVVAAFGWRNTGEILYLENHTTDPSVPQFVRQVVDDRHGAVHVEVADLDADGTPDFVALVSQEHEEVVAFLSRGDGSFRRETIFAADHPGYSCSGIELVDLDGDGDLDVLLTNGDVLDRPFLLKPYHGVQWLENEGGYPFTHHHLAPLYGASRAVAADFDGDGDLDVVAVSFLPGPHFPERRSEKLPSVILLEQRSKGEFVTHVLEREACDHFSCVAGDWDGDGRVDFAVGNYAWNQSQSIADPAVLFRNAGPPVPAKQLAAAAHVDAEVEKVPISE
jgi:tetratricopeptide (TPR) repeat protein